MITPRPVYLLALAIVAAAPLYAFATTTGAFTPLTNLPGLSNTLNSDTLPRFLNNLYRLSIGAVAVIAVLKIMQGGAELMFNKGSFSQATQAKKHIQNAVLGLLLVLSPAIVFGIINPDILNLSLNVERLETNYSDVATPEAVTRGMALLAFQYCNITVPEDKQECVDRGVRAVQDQVISCVTQMAGGRGSNCIEGVIAATRPQIRSCLPNLTPEQTSCLETRFRESIASASTGSVPPDYRGEITGGPMLRKGVFRAEAGMDRFVQACSSPGTSSGQLGSPMTRGFPMVRGCTNRCEAGTNSCPESRCTEYTAYCGAQNTFLMARTNVSSQPRATYAPHPQDRERYELYTRSCTAERGVVRELIARATQCPGDLLLGQPQYPNGCANVSVACAPQ